jgi:hypothetical protein
MKKLTLLLLALSIFQFCTFQQKDNVEHGFSIVVDKNADSLTLRAAKHLHNYWKKITGREIVIKNKKTGEEIPIYIGNQKAFPSLADSIKPLKNDGFIIAVNNKGIFLYGKTPVANLYAVNTLLEEQLGCMKFSVDEEYVPKKESVVFDKSYRVYNPAFSYRNAYFPGNKKRTPYSEWHKLHNINDVWGMYVHTFNKLLPPDKYFDEHPEYYSLVSGRRLRDAQLCLSNPDVVKLLIENIGKKMEEHPDKKYWSVSQNDAFNPCECDNCKRLYKKYGSYSGAYVKIANQVARKYPDKIISTLAYQFTRKAPENIKPDSNVNIMLCTIECSRSKPLEEFTSGNSFANDMKDWTKLTSNIYLWNYVVQFSNYLTPFPNFPVLQPNLKFFKKYGVDMVFEQGSSNHWCDLMELKEYMIAKLMWNPNINTDSLATLFINNYYGNASKYILNYYLTVNREMVKHRDDENLSIYGSPSGYTDSFLTPSLMHYYLSLMDKAEHAVASDSVFLRRVKRTRLPVDFAYIDISVNNNFETMPAIIQTGDGKEINPLIIHLLNKITTYAESDDRILVNERNLTVKAYRDYILNLLNRKLKNNKLKDAKISLLTECSPKYPVGKEKALNDNLLGPLDFHSNWLGFEGNDMIAVADFGKPVSFSKVEMNFLKAVNSWIFLPVKVTVEISNDGEHYKTVGERKSDNSDRDYLVKSVPYVFDFDTVNARYLRITAQSMKTCPVWHRGYGKPSWIFTDEVIVE